MTPNPNYICLDCGNEFLTEAQKERRLQDPLIVTMHQDVCLWCGQEIGVTHIRAFNWAQKRKIIKE
jgi:hypothetical protein